MQTITLVSAILASLAVPISNALPTVQENSLFAIGDSVKTGHPEAYNAFLTAPLITFDGTVSRRQQVPSDSTPDPDRPIVTPSSIFVLQCDVAGFRGNCLSFGAEPGECVNYSSFNSTQAFLDKLVDCNNKGDDRGVTLSYNYNLAEETNGYGGDYDNQISSWRC
ncbi:hypothetical protein UCDDA912_g07651 [Diaporthe ampelina]|uniref:Uncharacterized protein n=1 Tax=Diaporthe ampelina TaxID=1214573 RepID=A0A0G2FE38_9PEZI|nr:hypothetical protein UCDDA912_g07651 [Diaporthe ampelina]